MKLFESLQRKHPEIHKTHREALEVTKTTNKPVDGPRCVSDSTSSPAVSPFKTFFKPNKKYGPQHPQQLALLHAVLTFVCEQLLPLSTVECDSFRALMLLADPQFQVPSRKHLSRTVLFNEHKKRFSSIQGMLDSTSSICLTIDLWSSRQMRSYMGITVHFLKDWSLQTYMLS